MLHSFKILSSETDRTLRPRKEEKLWFVGECVSKDRCMQLGVRDWGMYRSRRRKKRSCPGYISDKAWRSNID